MPRLGGGRAGASRDIPVDLRPTLTIYTCWLTRTLHGGAALPVLRLAERPYKGSRWKSIPVPGPPRAIFPCNFFWRLLKMLDRCERCGANLALVGLGHGCVPRRYDAPPVTRLRRPSVTRRIERLRSGCGAIGRRSGGDGATAGVIAGWAGGIAAGTGVE